jgi:hypothetical protein
MGLTYPKTISRKVICQPVANSRILKSGNDLTAATPQIAFHSNLVYIFRGRAR